MWVALAHSITAIQAKRQNRTRVTKHSHTHTGICHHLASTGIRSQVNMTPSGLTRQAVVSSSATSPNNSNNVFAEMKEKRTNPLRST